MHQTAPTAGYGIIVSDDGEGVSDAALSDYHERGIRLDESIQGHGLGLSICKDIVDSYQGELAFLATRNKVDSKPAYFCRSQVKRYTQPNHAQSNLPPHNSDQRTDSIRATMSHH